MVSILQPTFRQTTFFSLSSLFLFLLSVFGFHLSVCWGEFLTKCVPWHFVRHAIGFCSRFCPTWNAFPVACWPGQLASSPIYLHSNTWLYLQLELVLCQLPFCCSKFERQLNRSKPSHFILVVYLLACYNSLTMINAFGIFQYFVPFFKLVKTFGPFPIWYYLTKQPVSDFWLKFFSFRKDFQHNLPKIGHIEVIKTVSSSFLWMHLIFHTFMCILKKKIFFHFLHFW